ncbi:MAG: hypothetical protein WBX25_31470 [Rhodomicrobium sp.]
MQNASTKNQDNSPENRKIIVNELHAKWGKFSEQELSALKGKDDLVSQVQAKYGLNKEQALRDIDAVLKGRHF